MFKVIIRTALFNFHYSTTFVSHAIMQQLLCENIKQLYNIFFISRGSACFNLFNIPVILEHLLDIFLCVVSSLDLCPELILGNKIHLLIQY